MLSHLFGGYIAERGQRRKSGTVAYFYFKGPKLTFQQKDHAASALTVLKMFGLERLVESLNGAGVHSLGNIITMDMELHASFDHLELWLEPTTTVSTPPDCCSLLTHSRSCR